MQNVFQCGACGNLVEEFTDVWDNETKKVVWVCDDCACDYEPLDDPDCQID